MNEPEIISLLNEAEQDYQRASLLLSKAKRTLMEVETIVIESKLRMEKYVELLRIHRNTHSQPEIVLRDEEIQQFRQDHPELVALAKERDRSKP
jgi:hypothetical protein